MIIEDYSLGREILEQRNSKDCYELKKFLTFFQNRPGTQSQEISKKLREELDKNGCNFRYI